MTRFHSLTAALASLILLVACGGGGVAPAGPAPDPVTFNDWVTGSGAADAPQQNDAGNLINGFLQSDENGDLLTGDLEARDDSDGNDLIQTLTFADFNSGSTVEGGVQTFIGGETGQTNPNYYAGVLGDTNLGAPISNERRNGAWSATLSFSSTIEPQFDNVKTNLNVRFDNGGTVDASTQIQDDYYLTVNGTFNDRGVISGQVNFANITSSVINSNYVGTGQLSGLIGRDGAVGAFHSDSICPASSLAISSPLATCSGAFAGGFVALPPANARTQDTVVRYGDWQRAAGADSITPTAGRNGFLQGDIGGVRYDNIPNGQRDSVDLSASRSNGSGLGGDDLDGVAFYQAEQNNQNNYYAAIYSSTRLGQPLSNESQDGDWNGVLGYIVSDINPNSEGEERTATRDMKLTVNFSTKQISADVAAHASGNLRFNLAGRFDRRGVFTGTTTLTGGTGAIAGTTQGTLVGLIGQEGAVGAFISNADQTTNPFAGGFVAAADSASDNNVDYSDWRASATPTAVPTPSAFRENQFLRSNAAGINASNDGVAANGAGQGSLHFGEVFGSGEAADGVAYYQHPDNAFYAGILSGTDLGAPVGSTGTALWNGRLEYVSGGAPINRPMTEDMRLNVNFAASSISARIKATASTSERFYFDITGTFTNRGVITGTTTYGTDGTNDVGNTLSNTTGGILTGLIGSDGAVGAFVSNNVPNPVNAYAGGFVASSGELRTVVDYDDWVRNANTVNTTRDTSLDRKNEFLQDGATGIQLPDNNSPNMVRLDFDAAACAANALDNPCGGIFSYRRGGDVNGVDVGARYAGILRNTNVGPAITNRDLRATWNGHLSLTRAASAIIEREVELRVNYVAANAAGTVDAFVSLSDSNRLYIHINGGFTNQGIISGTTRMGIFGDENTGSTRNNLQTTGPNGNLRSEGIVSGIIGENGAIGVFHSNRPNVDATGYSGGFIAAPAFSF